MTQTERIQIAATPRKKITIDLVGVEYVIAAPKGSVGIAIAKSAKELTDAAAVATAKARKLDPEAPAVTPDGAAMIKLIENWVVSAFGPKGSAGIQKRLADPDDDLDYSHLMELLQAVTVASSANPTS